MKHLFIVNPAAGKCDRTVQIRDAVAKLFEGKDEEYEIKVSKGPGDCTRIAREAAKKGTPVRIYACGGDGTVNEVINGVVGFDHVSVTHYPAGSGNDFIKIFDRPQAFRNLENLMDCEEAELDLVECRADDQLCYAANIVSIGLDARIAAEMPRYRRLPLISGSGVYYLSTVSNLFKGIHRPYEICVNGEIISGNQTLICICNGRWYGGSFNPVPQAEPDDGVLDVLIIRDVNVLQIARIIGKYQAGQYANYPDLIRHIRTDSIHILCRQESVVNLDGESMRGVQIDFSVSPHKLRFFYPKGLSYHAKQLVAAE